MKMCCTCLNEWGKRIMHTWAPPRGFLENSHHQRVQNGQKSSLIINFWRFQPAGHGAAFVSGEEFTRQTLGAVWVQTFSLSQPDEQGSCHLTGSAVMLKCAVLMSTPGRWGWCVSGWDAICRSEWWRSAQSRHCCPAQGHLMTWYIQMHLPY